MNRTRKIITVSIAALTLAGAVSATATPAAAWGWHHHHGWGWGGPAIAGGVIGGLALGAMAASAAPAYYDTCVTRQAVYDDWGRFRGYRRVRVAC
ncbi:MAG TPA: hypothetical protein PKA55_15805 [Rhodoblastus sp.]|nr:hypothetical protein [Rhodoblastus sp.]